MVLAMPAVGQAAVTVGAFPAPTSPLPPPNDQPPCAGGGPAVDLMQFTTAAGAPSYVVPAGGGVITSWSTSVTAGTGTVKLRVFSASSSATQITPIGESDPVTLTTASSPPFPARISVGAGDKLGFSIAGSYFLGCANSSADGANEIQIALTGPVGQPESTLQVQPVQTKTPALMNVSAILEPDVDKDRYGDETQDKCLKSPGSADGCPALQLSKPKANAKKGSATIAAAVGARAS